MKYTAIIVDDEPMVVELLSNLLTEYCEHLSLVAFTGHVNEAVKLIETKRPDLVFLDIHLPSGNGLQILDHFPTRFFEVVFITGYARLEPLAQRYNPLGILAKPIDVDELKTICSAFTASYNHKHKKLIRNENLL